MILLDLLGKGSVFPGEHKKCVTIYAAISGTLTGKTYRPTPTMPATPPRTKASSILPKAPTSQTDVSSYVELPPSHSSRRHGNYTQKPHAPPRSQALRHDTGGFMATSTDVTQTPTRKSTPQRLGGTSGHTDKSSPQMQTPATKPGHAAAPPAHRSCPPRLYLRRMVSCPTVLRLAVGPARRRPSLFLPTELPTDVA